MWILLNLIKLWFHRSNDISGCYLIGIPFAQKCSSSPLLQFYFVIIMYFFRSSSASAVAAAIRMMMHGYGTIIV